MDSSVLEAHLPMQKRRVLRRECAEKETKAHRDDRRCYPRVAVEPGQSRGKGGP